MERLKEMQKMLTDFCTTDSTNKVSDIHSFVKFLQCLGSTQLIVKAIIVKVIICYMFVIESKFSEFATDRNLKICLGQH